MTANQYFFTHSLLERSKTCIVVNSKHPHACNYGRPVRGGMSMLEAVYKAAYAGPAIEFKSLT